MTEYYKKPTKIGSLMLDSILLDWKKVKLWLNFENGLEGIILDLKDIYYLSSSPSNLIGLGLLNNHNIY